MSLPKKVVMASGNAGKIREMRSLLADLDIDVVPQADLGVPEAEETGSSFEENAIIKARHAARATRLAAIADDSGLVVEALDGRPGVFSARYAGNDATDDDNIDKLLDELAGIDERGAAFRCVACFLLSEDDEPLMASGEWRGEILRERRGDGGFGYDPVFLDPVSGRASAELSAAEKNARSHRGQALCALVDALRAKSV